MTGLCGWIGEAGLAGNGGAVLAEMRRGLGATDDEAQRAAPTYALAAYSPFAAASVHTADGLLAAVDGRPHWSDAGLAQLARESSPAAALLAAYQRHGVDCLQQIHGSFGLAILDPASRTALLAIDRMGVHRLCVAAKNELLIFGSTTDSVVAHPGSGRMLNDQGIFNYLFYHMVPAPGTIYSGVEKLLPGQFLLFEGGRLTRDFYWKAVWEDGASADFEAKAREFRQLLRDAVRDASAGEHLGAFLSGGTDSSTVTGVLAEVSGKPVESFSIGFDAKGFDEIEYARTAARRYQTHPHEYYVTPDDVVRAIPQIAAAYDEPFGNASAVPTYYCALKAKEAGVEVLLAGDGGDEIFGGNARYAKQRIFEAYWRIPRVIRSGLIEPALLHVPAPQWLTPLRKAQSYVRQARIPLPDRLESYNFLHTATLNEIFTTTFLAQIDSQQPIALLRDPYFRTQAISPINRMLHLDWKQTLADNDLRKVCRMCEAAGIEVRFPLLDDRIVAFGALLPPSYKVRGTYLRWFFKEALRDFLPPEIISKSKHGFGLPFGLWMHDHAPLRQLAYDSLDSFRRRGYMQPAYVDHLIHQHRTSHASYYGVMIWVIMMLEQWLQAHTISERKS